MSAKIKAGLIGAAVAVVLSVVGWLLLDSMTLMGLSLILGSVLCVVMGVLAARWMEPPSKAGRGAWNGAVAGFLTALALALASSPWLLAEAETMGRDLTVSLDATGQEEELSQMALRGLLIVTGTQVLLTTGLAAVAGTVTALLKRDKELPEERRKAQQAPHAQQKAPETRLEASEARKNGRRNWYLQPLRRYAVFKGRSRRREYWGFFLFNLINTFLLALIEVIFGSDQNVLPTLYWLIVLLPTLAVSVRRLHDTGRSGWWLLLDLVPVIGWIVVFAFLVQDSEPGENQYGPNPKA